MDWEERVEGSGSGLPAFHCEQKKWGKLWQLQSCLRAEICTRNTPSPPTQTRLGAISYWTAACVNGASQVGPSRHDQAAMPGTVTYEPTGVTECQHENSLQLHRAFRPLLQHDIRKFWRKCAHELIFTGSAHYFTVVCSDHNFWIRTLYVVLSCRALHYNKPTGNWYCARVETGNSFEPQTHWFTQLDSGCWDMITTW